MPHPLHKTDHALPAVRLDAERAAALYQNLHHQAGQHRTVGNVDEASALLETAARIRHHFLAHFQVDIHPV